MNMSQSESVAIIFLDSVTTLGKIRAIELCQILLNEQKFEKAAGRYFALENARVQWVTMKLQRLRTNVTTIFV